MRNAETGPPRGRIRPAASDRLEQRLAETTPDTAEHEEISSRLKAARADLIQARSPGALSWVERFLI